VAGVERIRRQQILREAEGYLDLIDLFSDQWVLPEPIRRRLAERSLGVLDRLASNFAEGPQALLLRGQALRAAERFPEAIEPLRAAAVAEPNRLDVWLALGWCYKRTGRLDLAIESLEQALVVDPQQGIVHYNLACYWSLAGQTPQALRYLGQAVAIESQFRRLAGREADFDPIRSDPGFQSLTSVVV
jgi:tetratricopeptide (TPR) repeat protein